MNSAKVPPGDGNEARWPHRQGQVLSNVATWQNRTFCNFVPPTKENSWIQSVTLRLLRSFLLKLARLGVNMIKQAIWWWLALRAKIPSQKALGLATCLGWNKGPLRLHYTHIWTQRLTERLIIILLQVAIYCQEPDSWFGPAKKSVLK